MDIKKQILEIYKSIKKFEEKNEYVGKLPSGAYFLENELVLIDNPIDSGARFPYAVNGLTIWAYASGYISINHSSFYMILPSNEGKEPYIDFFGIEDNKPVSLLGVSRKREERKNHRYTVYSKNIAYYFTITEETLYVVAVFMNNDEAISFTNVAYNLSDVKKEVTLSSFFNMLLKYEGGESVETKWFKKVSYKDDTFLYESPEDVNRHLRINNYGVIKRSFSKTPINVQNTTSRIDYVGARNESLRNASSIYQGKFNKGIDSTLFTDTAINGDLITFELDKNEFSFVTYQIKKTHQEDEFNDLSKEVYNFDDFLVRYNQANQNNKYDFGNFLMEFKDIKDESINNDVLNRFLKMVFYQIQFSALSSNSGTIFLGVRDVMQQLEASLIWDNKSARTKILEVLTFIDPSGIAPRQYSMPPKGSNAKMDLREFIDQGLWIVSTLYTYLTYTDDFSILDEECGYFERIEPNQAKESLERNSVLEHLIRVTNFLVSNIDPKTNCLKALYGDWNDALDGLGLVHGSTGYGDGVTVMATLQLYDTLDKMIKILNEVDMNNTLISKYQKAKDSIKEGIFKHAIIKKDDEQKIVHGWGDKKSYYVGSFNDPDNVSRDSLTSNAFFVISDMIKHDHKLKEVIMKSFRNLDSKYGLKTFEPYFEKTNDFDGFGRIVNLPKGTAENGATYIHATLFGVWALYLLGEGEFATEQLLKVLPLNHHLISTSPFIMSNSYVYNEEENMDGESMSDWYTGSANTLIKALVKGLFGLELTFEDIKIEPTKDFFSNDAMIKLEVGNKNLVVKYENKNQGKRSFSLNGNKLETKLNNLSEQLYVSISKKELLEGKENILSIED